MCYPAATLALMLVGLVCAVATPGWGPGGWRWWRLFPSRAGVFGDANSGDVVGVTLSWGGGGDGRGVAGDVPWHVLGGVDSGVDSALGVGDAGVADGEGVTGDTCWLVKPVWTPVAILGSLGVCISVPASRHWLISYCPVHLN